MDLVFETWVAGRQRSLLRTAWLLCGDASMAEDLVQATLLRCWPRWSRITRADDVDAYVRRVMLSIHLGWRGRRWRGEVPTERLPDRGALPDAPESEVMVAARGRLPRGQRAAVVLRHALDLSEAQTAEALGCSVGTVKSQTARALRALLVDTDLLQERHD